MNRQITFLFTILFFISIPCLVKSPHKYYPEEISGIDYLTNDLDGNKEHFVAAFSSAPDHEDKRNGIIIKQISANDMVSYFSLSNCNSLTLVLLEADLEGLPTWEYFFQIQL